MEHCDSKTGGICERVATWKQSVHVGGRPDGRIEYYSHWCDEHADSIAKKRRTDWTTAAMMTPIAPEPQ